MAKIRMRSTGGAGASDQKRVLPVKTRKRSGATKVVNERLTGQHEIVKLKLIEVRSIRDRRAAADLAHSMEDRILSFEEFVLETLDLIIDAL